MAPDPVSTPQVVAALVLTPLAIVRSPRSWSQKRRSKWSAQIAGWEGFAEQFLAFRELSAGGRSAGGAVPGGAVQLVPKGPDADTEQLRGARPVPSADLERAIDQARL